MLNEKSEIRKEISKIAKEVLSKDDFGIIHSVELCKKISVLPEFKNADTIFAYMSLPDEVNLARLIAEAFIAGKKVAIPRIDESTKTMTFHFITTETELHPNIFNILEPMQNHYPINLDESFKDPPSGILSLIPGRAFTKDGKRLGRGEGYYDKFLQKYGDKITKIGVCFPFQILDDLPTEETDCNVDSVIYN